MTSNVRSLDPEAAAAVVRRTFGDPRAPKTVADAAVASGLALRDAEAGLTWLTKEYRGHLRVTEEGQLLYFFPEGFSQPWIQRELLERFARAAGAAVLGALRFVVRAWLLLALVFYAVVFVAILVGLSAQKGERDDNRRSGELASALFRALFDALFWTFHPFSPFAYRSHTWAEPRRRQTHREPEVPLYEKVNRFVFGPSVEKPDPNAAMARLLAAIRAGKGRIGLSDVLRVTGLPRDQADGMMASLMLDYEGEVEVGERGGIYYRFEPLRKTAEALPALRPPPPAWSEMPTPQPLTGNTFGANLLVAILNGFNLSMSAFLLGSGFTLVDLFLLFRRIPPPWLPQGGVPFVLGLVPLLLSLLVFVVPLVRAAVRPWKNAKLARERGRLALLREVLERVPSAEPVREDQLKRAYRAVAGEEPSEQVLRERIVELGGDVDLEGGEPIRYRFPELEEEAADVADERERASDDEAKVGAVIFRSDE